MKISAQELKELLHELVPEIEPKHASLVADFMQQEEHVLFMNQLIKDRRELVATFMQKLQLYDIINAHLQIPNATVNKPYTVALDLLGLGKNAIIETKIEDLDTFGLQYDPATATISGTPIINGDFKIILEFKLQGEENRHEFHQKPITLIINANPRSLWKNIPSDQTDQFWKEDNTHEFKKLGGERNLVVASKRGRSHANVGSFRDDEYASHFFKKFGWSIVCVSDGAGSAKYSRKGSQIACESVISYFAEKFEEGVLDNLEHVISQFKNETSQENSKLISQSVYALLSQAALYAHKQLEDFSAKMEVNIKDFHSTLIFALFKKYPFGTAIMTFGVGDCPIGILNKDCTEIKLMNWLDVGEFGGGTRFITMKEIFNDTFATRFGFKLVDDFSYLMLMSDGIYDPKFSVEANLEKISCWNEFLADLNGNNEEKIKVDFELRNETVAQQLSDWMDFWSPGNHDDRTLAIIY